MKEWLLFQAFALGALFSLWLNVRRQLAKIERTQGEIRDGIAALEEIMRELEEDRL